MAIQFSGDEDDLRAMVTRVARKLSDVALAELSDATAPAVLLALGHVLHVVRTGLIERGATDQELDELLSWQAKELGKIGQM